MTNSMSEGFSEDRTLCYGVVEIHRIKETFFRAWNGEMLVELEVVERVCAKVCHVAEKKAVYKFAQLFRLP